MTHSVKVLPAALLSLALAACQQQEAATDADPRQMVLPPAEQFPGATVASIDGRPIPEDLLMAFLRMRGQLSADAEQRDRALRDLIDLVLLAREARDSTMLQRDSVQAELAVQRISSIANLALREVDPVSESEVQAVYESQVSRTGREEYRLRHLLVSEEAAAEGLVGRLQGGETFADLEQELTQSQGPSAAGDLGWVTISHVPPTFGPALAELETGQYTVEPVRSDYGWHVVLMEDRRPWQPPPLDEVEEGIRSSLSRQKLEQHISRLRENARIEIAPPPGE